MEIRTKQEVIKVKGYICDICNKECRNEKDPFSDYEYAILSAQWGYFSNKDLTAHECHMCESCFDQVKEFIESLGGKVRSIGQKPFSSSVNDLKVQGIDYIFKE